MKIKITRKVLKESNSETPLDETTLPPKGKISGKPEREDTKKFNPKGGPEFQTSYKAVNFAHEADPTLKVSPEELERELRAELSDVVKEPGVLDRVLGYLKNKLFKGAPQAPKADQSKSSPEAEKIVPPRPRPSGAPQSIPAALADQPEADPSEFGDEMEDPDPYGRKSKDREARDFVDKFGQLQEIARRHFKTRK